MLIKKYNENINLAPPKP